MYIQGIVLESCVAISVSSNSTQALLHKASYSIVCHEALFFGCQRCWRACLQPPFGIRRCYRAWHQWPADAKQPIADSSWIQQWHVVGDAFAVVVWAIGKKATRLWGSNICLGLGRHSRRIVCTRWRKDFGQSLCPQLSDHAPAQHGQRAHSPSENSSHRRRNVICYRAVADAKHCYRACFLWHASALAHHCTWDAACSFNCNTSRVYLRTQNEHVLQMQQTHT